MNNDLMFSSKNSKWETDPELLAKLAPHFPWDLDVCAERGNVCSNYISPAEDAFKRPWDGLCWLNPPYTRSIGKWIARAREQSSHNPNHETTVVCLVPARTDTKWWQNNVIFASYVVFIKGRLKFGSDKYWVYHWLELLEKGKLTQTELNKKLKPTVSKDSAPFPSAIVVFGPLKWNQVDLLGSLGWMIEPKYQY
jgi:phage N-6-adenine-methyltransferase